MTLGWGKGGIPGNRKDAVGRPEAGGHRSRHWRSARGLRVAIGSLLRRGGTAQPRDHCHGSSLVYGASVSTRRPGQTGRLPNNDDIRSPVRRGDACADRVLRHENDRLDDCEHATQTLPGCTDANDLKVHELRCQGKIT